MLVNLLWHSFGKSTHVHFDHSRAFSYHYPAIVRFFHNTKVRSNFKFFNMWASHENFLGLISDDWCSDDFGSPIYILYRKLKKLKQPLKKLNQLHFSHISKRVDIIEKALKDHQTALHVDKDNPLLLEEEKHLKSQLIHLKLVEKNVFSSKT